MSHALDSCWAKIDRAKESVHKLNEEISEFLSPDRSPYRVEKTIHLNSNKYSFTAVGPPLPLRFSVLAGEIIHHLRSSLDHVVWALARQNVSEPGRVQFPVCDSPQKFDNACKSGALRGVSKSACAIIESVQPYQTADPTNSGLYQLHSMDVIDKHRLLVVTTNVILPGQEVTIDPGHDHGVLTNIHVPEKPLGATEHGVEVFSLIFEEVHPAMTVDVNFTVDIVFEEVGPRLQNPSVVQVLAFFCRRVSTTVRMFEAEF